jgi:lactoylglutathione lyase
MPPKFVISHIALQVTSLQQSTLFYQDIIGLQPLEEPFKLGRHSWFALGPACQLHLIAGATQVPQFHIDHHLALSTPNLEDFIEKLTQSGVTYYDARKIPGVVHVRPDGIRQVFFQDPDGYWLEMNNEDPVPNNPE